MVAQRRRWMAATQKGNLVNMKEKTDVDKGGDHVGSSAKQPMANEEQS